VTRIAETQETGYDVVVIDVSADGARFWTYRPTNGALQSA